MPIGAALTWDDDHCVVTIISSGEGTYLVSRIRAGRRRRRQARVGVPDAALTPNAGLAAVSELCDRLDVIGALDAAVGPGKQRDRGFGAGELLAGVASGRAAGEGPVRQRDRGFGAGELLAGLASAQLAGEDFLVGLDRQRADAAGQQLPPVPGLASSSAGGGGPRPILVPS